METALIICGFTGFVMIVAGLARIVPELAIDLPLGLLLSLMSRRWEGNLLELVHAHIQAGWPETRLDAVLLYGGLICLAITAAALLLRVYLAGSI